MKSVFLMFPLLLSVVSCGYNTLQQQDEYVKSTWAQVLNQYQRRADLVPNLVGVVKAYAAHEQAVFEEVARARSDLETAKVSTASVNDANALERYSRAQQRMGQALSRLLLVAENYPQLKADGVFQDLQTQLEGTENRIAYARQKYIIAVQNYNVTVRSFPSNLTAKYLGHHLRPTYTVEDESRVSKVPSAEIK